MMFRKFLQETKGQVASSIISNGAMLFIGILVIAQIIASITGLTGTANTTFNTIVGYLWTGLGLVGVGLIALAGAYAMQIVKQMRG